MNADTAIFARNSPPGQTEARAQEAPEAFEQAKPIRELVSRPPTVKAGKVDSASVERMFCEFQDVSHVVILDNGRLPVGLLTRSMLYIKTGGAYGYALFANKLVDSLATADFIKAEAGEPASKVAESAMERRQETLYDPIVVVEANGNFLGTVTVKDLLESAESSIMKAKRKAEAAARLKSEFLSAMSHEIRTPLNAIVNMAKALSKSELDAFQRDCAETLSESSRHLLGVVNDILDFSRLEAGRLAIEKVDFNLPALLNYCFKAMRPQAQDKELSLSCEIDAAMPQWVKGDPLRLRQVLLNLLGNAVKFTERGSIALKVVRIGQGEGQAKALFRVSDSGPGIPKRMLPGLFKRFSQTEVSTCRMHGGSGLGLAICRQLAELMGGSIWAESQEGKGSVFSFTVCLAEGSPESAVELEAQAEHAQSEAHGFARINAMLVEDNPFNIKVAKLLFGEMGHSLKCHCFGHEAIAELKEGGFDMLLTDLEMPEMDGFEVARRVRAGQAGQENATIPIIALSAHVGEAWRERCQAAGMDAYLSKPVEPSELASILRRFARKPKAATQKPGPGLSETASFFDIESTKLRSGGSGRLVEKMRAIFAEESPRLLDKAGKALEAQELPLLRILAHSLKGNAAAVDAKACAGLAKALEAAALASDLEECKEIMPGLKSMFSKAINALNAKQRKAESQ